jgi:hypothetical protein
MLVYVVFFVVEQHNGVEDRCNYSVFDNETAANKCVLELEKQDYISYANYDIMELKNE